MAGLSMGVANPEDVVAKTKAIQEWPDHLVEGELRQRANLPLNPDGSAPEHPPESAGDITGTIWRYTQGQAPEIEYDFRKMAIRLDSRGLAKLGGTLRFSDWKICPKHLIPRCYSAALRSPLALLSGQGFASVTSLK